MQSPLNNLGKILKTIFLALQDFLSKQALQRTLHPLPNNLPIEVKLPTRIESPVITVEPMKPEVINLSPQSSGFLICPIQGNDADGKQLTSRTVKIASVIDHSGTAIQPGSTYRWGLGAKDKIVKAFNDEVGNGEPSAGKPYGYTKQVPAPFFSNKEINYVGSSGPGDKYGPTYYLNYDGHAGYDFPYLRMTPVVATADGFLHKASKADDPIYGADWSMDHSFFIKHENSFVSWFRHCTKLIDDLENQILNDFSKTCLVKEGQVIAYVGNIGTSGVHLHLEVRDKQGRIVDPYSDRLWKA